MLEAADGSGTREIARELDTTPTTVSLWRGRFARERLDGLEDLPRSGTPPQRSHRQAHTGGARSATTQRLCPLERTADREGPGRRRRAVRLAFPAQTKDRSRRSQELVREQRSGVRQQGSDVVGLYMAPPDNAVVICVDEKPSIQGSHPDRAGLQDWFPPQGPWTAGSVAQSGFQENRISMRDNPPGFHLAVDVPHILVASFRFRQDAGFHRISAGPRQGARPVAVSRQHRYPWPLPPLSRSVEDCL